jgi:formate/nitrite transporter FocA (FNT family)
MYFAVNGYKKLNDFSRFIIVYLGVVVFILCGFEHCIANMYYISLAKAWSFKSAISMLFMIFGNSFGAIIMSLFNNKNKIKA